MTVRLKKRIFWPLLAAGLGLPSLIACARDDDATRKLGVDLGYRNLSVRPGDDFDEYANGGWRKNTVIQPHELRVSGRSALLRKAEQRTEDLIGEAAGKAAGSERMIADYYAAYLDTDEVERRGLDPLRPKLDEISALGSKTDLARLLGQRLRADVDPLNDTDFWTDNLFGLFVTGALGDTSRSVPYLLQGGLGMPSRDYYLSGKPDMAGVRAAYQTYVSDMLRLAGIRDAARRAENILALESKMAAVHLDRLTSWDVQRANNPWSPAQLARKAPGLDWNSYLKAAGLDQQPTLIIWQPEAIVGLSRLVGSEPLETWKDWMTVRTLSQNAPYLPKAYDDLHFGFYEKTLNGALQQADRRKRAITLVNTQLGDAIGRIYAARYFPASSKAMVEEMVRNILAALVRRIEANSWMSPATKRNAIVKVKNMRVEVGYPRTWRDYGGLVVRRDDALGNAWRAAEYETKHQLAKLGKPVDRGEWWLNVQRPNAIHLPLQNALNFPAARLEPPYFDPEADAAANYGAIGSVIGHEIGHGFDDLGSRFGPTGTLENWWTAEDFARFKELGKGLVEQYSGYELLPGVRVNGELTLAENIADVVGLAAAYDAYKMSLGGRQAPVIDGLTGDQRFFLAFAQAWREKARDAALRKQVLTDGHSFASVRAQTVRNIDAWYDAYQVKPGDKLYLSPAKRVRIW